jgi:hypothetical protein
MLRQIVSFSTEVVWIGSPLTAWAVANEYFSQSSPTSVFLRSFVLVKHSLKR